MSWFALHMPDGAWISETAPSDDDLVVRGALLIETRLPEIRRPMPLLAYEQKGDWPLYVALHALPGGGIAMVLNQAGDVIHRTLDCTQTGRADLLRVTYVWDAPKRRGWLALELPGQPGIEIQQVRDPKPFRAGDLCRLTDPGEHGFIAPDVLWIGLADAPQPVGPMPTLLPDTPVDTPSGYRRVEELKRGDLVLSGEGRSVPVLHAVRRMVPATGSFAPLRMRAPFFGLRRNIVVGALQRILVSGSDIDYLFGHEAALIRAGDLLAGPAVQPVRCGRFIPYVQLLLPEPASLECCGARLESLFIGRLRRKPEHLAASVLANADRTVLPEHAQPMQPVLRAFDAAMLAAHRAA